jgi:predicted nucleotidyltransferase
VRHLSHEDAPKAMGIPAKFAIIPVLARSNGMTRLKIKVPRKKVADFCRKNHISRMAFFGSVLRDDFRPDSDIDVLVEFEAGHVPGLAFFTMQEELSNILGRQVDLFTPKFISPYFRDQVIREARVAYA